MTRTGGQKIVAATFRHDTSRNLDPQLHTHAVLANMVKGEDGKWRSMSNEGLYARQKLIGMLYRNELAASLSRIGYEVEKSHADGRFEIAGVSRETVEAFSTRRAEIEAAMNERGLGASADNPRLAERAALDDKGRQARHRPGRAEGRLAAPGRRSGPRCSGNRGRRDGTVGRARDAIPRPPPRTPSAAAGQATGLRIARRACPAPAGNQPDAAPEPPPSPAAEAMAWAMAASLGARGGVLAERPARGRACPRAGQGDHRRGRTRG